MDPIYKFQPHRTMHLQGFDAYGAAAALWGASDTGFNISGVFRDQGDFAVVVLFQRDDPFGHPRFSYLPDGNVSGLKLDFGIEFQGIQAFESKRWPWIDWAYINAYDESGNLLQHPLISMATGPSGRTGASGTFTLNAGTPTSTDRVTLWYQNRAFDYSVSSGSGGGSSCVQAIWSQSASPSCEQDIFWQSASASTDQAMWWQGDHESCVQAMWWQGNANYTHYVQIQTQAHGWNHIYGVQEDGLNSAQIAQNIAAQINSTDPYCAATVGGQYGNEITVALKTLIPLTDLVVSSSDGGAPATLTMYVHWVQIGSNKYQIAEDGLNSAQIASALAGQINSADPNCSATVGGQYNNEITIALKPGVAGPVTVSSSDGSSSTTLSDYVHWVQIGTTKYSCDQGGLSSAQIASNIAGQIAASDPNCTATASSNAITISLRTGVSGPITVSSSDGSGPATLSEAMHCVTIGSATYSCAQDGLSSAQIAQSISDQINAGDPNCTAAIGGPDGDNDITITLKSGVQGPITVSSSDGSASATLTAFDPAAVCSQLADLINQTDWSQNGPVALSATAAGNQITITAEPGADGNVVTFYELHASENLYFSPSTLQLAGGSSDNVRWHVAIDFGALGWTDLTKVWLTFAPALANSAAYTPTEWSVNVTNWAVTDPNGVRPLKVAGPGSLRLEEDDPWVKKAGYWEDPSIVVPEVAAYWSKGRAIRSAYSQYETRTLTIETHCQSTHDVYLGTWLDTNCGIISATLDGGTPVTLDCYGSGFLVRRRLFQNVAPGHHTVFISMTGNKNANSGGWYFYCDFLECAVLTDVPNAPETRADVGLATDFDTDNTYKLSPQRLIWNLQKLGLVGEIDHYCGVFWWNQRKAAGGNYPIATITFDGAWQDQDVVWVHIGDGAIGKTVFPTDTSETIAAHFAYFINATLVGVWAEPNGAALTITCRSRGDSFRRECDGRIDTRCAGDHRKLYNQDSMTAQRWKQIESIFHQAVALQSSEREVFLNRACAGDGEFRAEVDQLLSADLGKGSLLGTPAFEFGSADRLSPADRLGPYEITGLLGAGGMGEVYRAKDTRLDRTVAIKVLPADLADNPDARQRFEREARAVSSLNHPHICVLHDVGCEGGIDFLIMEYLEGESLAARLSKGPLAIHQVLQYAIQIADALAAAHRQGIFHRDLKPGNVMLTKSGAKLMDFGLAKLRASDKGQPVGAASLLSTMSQPLTQEGTIVGTFQYMAPELLEGTETDARADIFAFGAVLYEMLTGRKAFEGQTQASVIGAILHAAPAPLSGLQPLTPPALDRLVSACLTKDPDERWQTAHDLKLELQWIETGQAAEFPSAASPNKRERALWVVATVLLLVLAATAWITSRRSGIAEPLRLTVAPPQSESLVFSTNQGGIAISPDGRTLAFVATSQGTPMVWLRGLDSLVAKPLAGTEGGYYPFWSPDSRFLGFFAGGKLKKIGIRGGLPVTLCDAPEGRGGTWNRDGVIVLAPGFGATYRISAGGGTPAQLTSLDAARQDAWHSWPSFLPDGRHFLYLAGSSRRENDAIFVGSVDAGPETQKPIRLVAANSNALYSPPHDGRPGYLLSVVDRTLTAQQFDAGRLKVEGEPISLAEEVGYLPNIRLENFSLSQTGLLVYGAKGSLPQVTWIGRDGKPLGVLGAPGDFHFLSLSPDEKRVAVVAVDTAGHVAMWMVDVSRGTSSRLSVDISRALAPRWSPDSQQIAFSHLQEMTDKWNIFHQSVSGATAAERLTRSENVQILDDWSGDGRFLVYSEQDPKTRSDLWVLPLSGERKPFPYLATPFNERHGKFAPAPGGAASRWLAYTSDETGGDEVYVQSFPAPGTKVRISTTGGVQPRWRRDGKELFYLAPDGSIMAAPVNMTSSGLQAEAPVALCRPPRAPLPAIFASVFEVSADGQRFLILAPSNSNAPGINVVANWDAGLNR